ncbi:MAG: hypothetical protein EXS31_18715 [Pedosphaera sp.]|nr:hypothetical protein [Pedosphaera sp.]
MKKNRPHDDGMEWLRALRLRVAKECGFDLAKQAEVYRRAAAKHPYKIYQGEHAIVRPKKRLKVAA